MIEKTDGDNFNSFKFMHHPDTNVYTDKFRKRKGVVTSDWFHVENMISKPLIEQITCITQ